MPPRPDSSADSLRNSRNRERPATDSVSSRSGGGRREAHADQAAAAGRIRRLDRPAVRLGGLAHDRESEARAGPAAGIVGAVEALEDVRQISGGEAGAVVAHGEDA